MRDSINTVDELLDRAIELGHTCIAFTEHETISNAIEIEEAWDKRKEKNPEFKVIRGNEIYLCRNGLNADNFIKGIDHYNHFILLARDAIGHKQIREISTRAWMRSYMARGLRRVPTYYQDLIDIIGENRGHIIASSACIGGCLGQQLLKYRDSHNELLYNKIKTWCLGIQDIFGKGNFFLEMQPSDSAEQIYVNDEIIKISKELNIPFIITNDAHYLKAEDLKYEKAFLNSQNGEREVESFYATTYLMTNQEIHNFMDKHIGTDNVTLAFNNIQAIADRCENYSLQKPLRIPILPWREFKGDNEHIEQWIKRIPYLEKFLHSDYLEDRTLVDAVIDGINHHIDLQNKEAWDEINACLEDTWISSNVNNARWSAYFLNLQKTIDVCWDAGTVVGCGRGSGVGFILLYVLDITQINPLREKTKTFRFRFLNPSRVSVLDIDTDITGLHRDRVLDKLRQFYGQDRCANVLTLKTEKSKSAILSAARALNIDVDIARYLSGMIESDRGQLRTLDQTFYGDEDKDMAPNKQFRFEMENNYPELWEAAKRFEGLIVGIGVHAGGIIFVDEPFTESTALMRAPNGVVMTQFDLHKCEKAS